MKKIIKALIQEYRSTVVIGYLHKLSVGFINAYFNASNHDFQNNGEKNVLEKCSKFWNYKQAIVLFDVGANKGEWSVIVAKLFHNSFIHAFEIIEQTYKVCQRNLASYKSISVNNFGLSDIEKMMIVNYYPEADTGSSIYRLPWGVESIALNCQLKTGDHYVITNCITKIDFLKIDAEGEDYNILLGFKETLSKDIVEVIQFEYNKTSILSKKLLIDFYNYLDSFGYAIGRIHKNYVDFKSYDLFYDENMLQGNFLAVKKENHKLIQILSQT